MHPTMVLTSTSSTPCQHLEPAWQQLVRTVALALWIMYDHLHAEGGSVCFESHIAEQRLPLVQAGVLAYVRSFVCIVAGAT